MVGSQDGVPVEENPRRACGHPHGSGGGWRRVGGGGGWKHARHQRHTPAPGTPRVARRPRQGHAQTGSGSHRSRFLTSGAGIEGFLAVGTPLTLGMVDAECEWRGGGGDRGFRAQSGIKASWRHFLQMEALTLAAYTKSRSCLTVACFGAAEHYAPANDCKQHGCVAM